MGTSNVCYPLTDGGDPKGAAWMAWAVRYIESCRGPNRLRTPVDEAEIAEDAARELRRGQGRSVASDEKARKALEEYGVTKAMAYFAKKG
jgi:hypothetical protein